MFLLNRSFLRDFEQWARGRLHCQERKGQKETNTFLTCHVRLFTPVLLLFQYCIKSENFKVSVKQEDSAFSETRETLIKIECYFGRFYFEFKPKRNEEVRNVEKLIISLLAKKRSINFQWKTKQQQQKTPTALQIYKMFITYGLWIWTIISLISKAEIWQFNPEFKDQLINWKSF